MEQNKPPQYYLVQVGQYVQSFDAAKDLAIDINRILRRPVIVSEVLSAEQTPEGNNVHLKQVVFLMGQ